MIGVIGLSHKSAPIEVREKFAFQKDEIINISRSVIGMNYFSEVVVLSTCNRTEIYFNAEGICTSGSYKLITSVLPHFNVVKDDEKKLIYSFYNTDAVNHLFRVISSLDSMILGEYQIVSQVKDAFNTSKEIGAAGKIFERLFNKALETGKDVRSQTELSKGAFSISYAAVEKCGERFTNLANKNILIIGAGETSELVLKNFYNKGCTNITIANRTNDKACELAAKYNGKAIDYDQIMQSIHDAEIIVSSVAVKEPLFCAETIKAHLNGHESIVMIDLGVPRNIHPNVNDIPAVSLLNVDDLEQAVAKNMQKKQAYISIAEDIIKVKVVEFSEWLYTQNLAPAIGSIVKALTAISKKELAIFKDNATFDEYNNMEAYSKQIIKKMRNALVTNLKDVTDNGRNTEHITAINLLFSGINDSEKN